jgi:hypothetical protein
MVLLGNTNKRLEAFVYGAITLYGPSFQYGSTSNKFCNSLQALAHLRLGPTTPTLQRR